MAVSPGLEWKCARPKSVIQTFPANVDQQVPRLDVAVNDALLMGVFQRLGRLGHATRRGTVELHVLAGAVRGELLGALPERFARPIRLR